MKFLFAPVLLAVLVYGGWPYVDLYRLDHALLANDHNTLAELVDLEAVKRTRKASLDKQVNRSVSGSNPAAGLVRDGVRWMGEGSIESQTTMDWFREVVRRDGGGSAAPYPSLIKAVDFAFFDGPTRFLVRLGALDEAPVHLRMRFRQWGWVVTEVHP